MEEDDETQSLQSHADSPNPPPTTDITVTKPKPQSSLALVVHTPSNPRVGGGRDDCWSEEATKILIEAWGDRFSEPGKGTLKQQQWKQVAEIVNNSGQFKYPKTDIQCKNRIDTVKKKYKQEKAKFGDGGSKWLFFKKLESLIGGCGGNGMNVSKRMRVKRQVVQPESMRWHFRKRSASETESESEEDSAESLPPPPAHPLPQGVLFKRMKVEKPGGGGGGVGEVAKAIMGFTEAYEKAENAKLKLMMDLEKERMKFAKEMELQRMQFLKTQMEISSQKEEEWNNNNRRGERRNVVDDDDDENDDRHVKNNGDVSS